MFNPADYDQEVYEFRNGITARRAAEAAEEAAERKAREWDFNETDLCTKVCCDTLIHQSAECTALATAEREESLPEVIRSLPSEGDNIQAWLDGAPDSVLQRRTSDMVIAERMVA